MRALACLPLVFFAVGAVGAASCGAPEPGFRMQLLAPAGLIDEVNHWDLRVWASADASCNGPAVTVPGGAPPVLAQGGIGQQSVTLTVPSGARVFAVDGFSDASGATRIAQGCQAATLETNVPANVTIRVVRVGGPPPRVVFGSTQNGPGMTALFIVDSMGGTPKQVTSTPVVSPGSDFDYNGGSVVFTGIGGATQLYTARVDGVGDTPLAHMGGSDQNPVFSPDGSRVAFVSTRTGTQQVEVLELSGMVRVQASSGANPAVAPAWSPDSLRLAWVEKGGAAKLLVANPDGTNAKTLTAPLTANAQPVWRQGGQLIVALQSTGKDDLVVWDAATDLRVTTLASLPGIRHPSLAPDGNVLLFVADGSMGDGDLYKYDFQAQGTKLTPIATTGADEDWPAWAPAQNEIAFAVDSKVEVAAPDGSGARRLTQAPGFVLEVHPLFAPVQ